MSASLQRLDTRQTSAGAPASHAGPVAARAALALARTIEDQIVPRLIVARAPPPVSPPSSGLVPLSADVLDLSALAIGGDPEAARHHVTGALARQSYESVCLDLLAPAARHLGQMWDDDLCSFTDVSIGLARLHESLRDISHDGGDGAAEGMRRRKILLAQAPGDQHMFGLSMVSNLFSHAGWSVTALFPGHVLEMTAALRREWFGVVGISLGSEVNLQNVATMLPRLRECSRNRSIAIMVGGPLFVACPDIARQIGADATAADGVQATWQAENLLTARPGYC